MSHSFIPSAPHMIYWLNYHFPPIGRYSQPLSLVLIPLSKFLYGNIIIDIDGWLCGIRGCTRSLLVRLQVKQTHVPSHYERFLSTNSLAFWALKIRTRVTSNIISSLDTKCTYTALVFQWWFIYGGFASRLRRPRHHDKSIILSHESGLLLINHSDRH